MMRLGIFESAFERPTLLDAFDAVHEAGFSSVQFDYASAGARSQSEDIRADIAQSVKNDASRAGIQIASVSGTFNMIHPDTQFRESGLATLERIASTCATIGTGIVTLCTGTRDTVSMWRGHVDNGSPQAWAELLGTVTRALAIADRHDVRLVVEPEPANVVSDADRALSLLDEVQDPRLKIVLDPANILAGDPARSPEAALDYAFDLLGEHIILAHAKDLDEAGRFCAAGTGVVPWDHYRRLLQDIAYDGDVIFHTLTEDQVMSSITVMTG